MDERSRFYGPTLYVKGGKSSYVSSRYEDQIKSVTPDYEITSIDDAGHYVHAEKPQEFISRIVPFIVHHK
jgi:esterase